MREPLRIGVPPACGAQSGAAPFCLPWLSLKQLHLVVRTRVCAYICSKLGSGLLGTSRCELMQVGRSEGGIAVMAMMRPHAPPLICGVHAVESQKAGRNGCESE